MKITMSRIIQSLLIAFLAATSVYAKNITVYHTSDSHGYYFDANGTGGFARLTSVVKNGPSDFLLFSSGDWANGNYEANMSLGKDGIKIMNKIGYSAITLGNHEFDLGEKNLFDAINLFDGEVLAANMTNLPKKVKDYHIFTVDGVKVGVMGLGRSGPGMKTVKFKTDSKKEGMTLAVIEPTVEAMLAEGAQVIISLNHDSVIDKKKPTPLSEEVFQSKIFNKIDLILGGHGHRKGSFRMAGHEDGPMFVESSSKLKNVSAITIDFNEKTNEVESIDVNLIDLKSPMVKEDADMKKFVDAKMAKGLTEVKGSLPKALTKFPAKGTKTLGSPIADIVADEMQRFVTKDFGEHTDFSIFQLNAVRRDLDQGDLTGRAIAQLFPYNEYVVVINLPGSVLKHILENQILDEGTKTYSLFSYSQELQAKYSSEDFKFLSAKISGKKLDVEKTYRIALITHIADGFYEAAGFFDINPYRNEKVHTNKMSMDLFLNVINRDKNHEFKAVPHNLTLVNDKTKK